MVFPSKVHIVSLAFILRCRTTIKRGYTSTTRPQCSGLLIQAQRHALAFKLALKKYVATFHGQFHRQCLHITLDVLRTGSGCYIVVHLACVAGRVRQSRQLACHNKTKLAPRRNKDIIHKHTYPHNKVNSHT